MKKFITIGIVIVALSVALVLSLSADDVTGISVIEIDNGVRIENTSNVACLVFVSSPNSEQRFELSVGQSVVLTDITKPIEISAVSK